jgi:putative ABC transport system substrate-binding protein
MRRRELIMLLGGTAAPSILWPLAARAQQPALPVIGFLHSGSPATRRANIDAFLRGLAETGYAEGQNITIAYRWANDQPERLPALAADLVGRGVAVMVAMPNASAAVAAKAASTTIPIVFRLGDDPIALALVASLARPGGNITGIASLTGEVIAKRLELLREMAPAASVVALLVNPASAINLAHDTREILAAAAVLGVRVLVLEASTPEGIAAAFTTLVDQHAGALLVNSDALFFSQRDLVVALAARNAVPAIYSFREHVAAGGLMSYGTDTPETYRQAAKYVGRILKGEKPADLPVQQVTRVELVINLKTAKALGLAVPLTLLGRADEVIE